MPIIYTYPQLAQPEGDDLIVISDVSDGNKTKNTTVADIGTAIKSLNYPFDVFKQVCTPISLTMPDNNGGVNWFYTNAVMNKWVFTANNPEVKQNTLAEGSSVNIEVAISAGTDVGNNVEWSLRLYDNAGNYYQLAASTGEGAPNNIGQPLISNGPTTAPSDFTSCVSQTRVANLDLKTDFFNRYSVEVGELQLWIRNNGDPAQGSIITSCSVNLYN